MEVHGGASILPRLQGVNKLFGDGFSKADVVAAAAPQPTVATWENGRKLDDSVQWEDKVN